MMITVLFYVFVAVTTIQIIYYLCFSIFAFHSNSTKKKEVITPISVIICAKNEAKNLQEFLPFLINQKYTNFEIVLINDASTDLTLGVMEDFRDKNDNIKIVNVENNEAFWGNKKYALTLGIKAATNDHLLFIDADCKPASKEWISEMTQQFTTEKTIVLGYGKYKYIKYSFINLLVRFETLLTAIQYFSFTKLGTPYMAVGRNLAYNRDEFFKVNGFIKHIKIRSGDDDLFIQDAANKINTTICASRKSFTVSETPLTFKEWFHQKRLHLTRTKYYKFKHTFFLKLFSVSKAFFFLLATILFFLYPWENILPIVLIYYVVQFIIIGLSAKKLQEPQVTYFLPFLEIGLLIFQFSIFITNLTSKPIHWK